MTTNSVTLPRYPAPTHLQRRRSRTLAASVRGWRPSEGLLLFFFSATAYLSVAAEMVSRRVIFADGLSRVANGYFVLFSRDPHLPAVGFVWNPLPSLALLPLLLFRGVFPSLVRDGFAGDIESALFMAGTVALLASSLARLGLRRLPRLALVALFALHPLILTYAGNGESEAALLFFLLLAVHSLLGWLSEQHPGRLVSTGLALGLAYLSRYEAVAPALGVVALVAGVTYLQTHGNRALRVRFALNDVALVGLPFVFAFGLWAVSSRVLVHAWFPTFSSEYGNAAQVRQAAGYITGGTGSTLPAALHYAASQLFGLEPLVLPLLLAVAVLAIRRRDWLALAAPTVLGAVLAFDNLAFLAGSSFGWLRFQITVVPLTVLLCGTLLRYVPQRSTANQGPCILWRAVTPLGVLALAVALPLAGKTLTDHSLAREETSTMLAAIAPQLATADDRRHLRIFQTEKQIAADLDALHLPDSSVLTDSAYAFPTILASQHPRQFVITSDRDFRSSVADPVGRQIRYLLVPQPTWAPIDALQRARPDLYRNGGGISTVVMTWHGTSYNGDWRLLKITV